MIVTAQPSENAGTYAPSFGALCAAAFEAERERAAAKNTCAKAETDICAQESHGQARLNCFRYPCGKSGL